MAQTQLVGQINIYITEDNNYLLNIVPATTTGINPFPNEVDTVEGCGETFGDALSDLNSNVDELAALLQEGL